MKRILNLYPWFSVQEGTLGAPRAATTVLLLFRVQIRLPLVGAVILFWARKAPHVVLFLRVDSQCVLNI